jgi:glycosyltransferase involved in cell wall biosynthesis
MNILVLTWEFPPRIVGGISRHVAELYPELVKRGHQIHLLTVQAPSAPVYEQVEGMEVHRVAVGESKAFLDWVAQMNESMATYAMQSIPHLSDFDIVHAHDWLVGEAAIALKHQFKLPLVVTIHATEHGRNFGIHSELHHYVHHQEHTLTHEAWRVIVCTTYMQREVRQVLHVPNDKIAVIYNGIRSEKKNVPSHVNLQDFRRRFARDDEQIVYYVGRITHEKGIGRLLEAVPQVLVAKQGRVKFVIIGGGDTSAFQRQVQQMGICDHCLFTGFMPDRELDWFQTIADCAVFPSLYEPFGIVALESFAARVPVVVSDTGGLPEIVHHGRTGVVTYADNPDSISWGILSILNNPEFAQQLVDNAYQELQARFRWDALAQQTEAVYQQVLQERMQIAW